MPASELKSKSQVRLMRAAAHTPGGYGGVPQSVGKEFAGKPRKNLPERLSKKKKHRSPFAPA